MSEDHFDDEDDPEYPEGRLEQLCLQSPAVSQISQSFHMQVCFLRIRIRVKVHRGEMHQEVLNWKRSSRAHERPRLKVVIQKSETLCCQFKTSFLFTKARVSGTEASQKYGPQKCT